MSLNVKTVASQLSRTWHHFHGVMWGKGTHTHAYTHLCARMWAYSTSLASMDSRQIMQHRLKRLPSHTFSIMYRHPREGGREESVYIHLWEIWDIVSIPHLHCMYYYFLLWIQHIPLETDWMGPWKATSSLWDPRRHRKQIFCVSCALIKNTEGIKNGYLWRRLSRWQIDGRTRHFHTDFKRILTQRQASRESYFCDG